MPKYFGTDGFRGKANERLTPKEAYAIGRFLGGYYNKNSRKAKILIGKDTRRSSYMLEGALVSGITASGGDAYLLHVTTTPSVSFLSSADDFDVAVMISASHNRYCDNGIKIINSLGEKADDEIIEKIESYLDGKMSFQLKTDEEIGKAEDYFSGRNRYMSMLLSIPENSFKGYKIALDTANGSTYMIAKTVFSSLGAKIVPINDTPNGININENCGATNVNALQKAVVDNACDMGFAFDGDGDRCIACDENGKIVDGDGILFALAVDMKERGILKNDTVVATVDSNIGLDTSLAEKGIRVIRTDVGDRYVYEKMREGYMLGGERSGHIIAKKYMRSGDGIMTALLLTDLAIKKKCPFSALFYELKKLSEYSINLPVNNKSVIKDVGFIKTIENIRERYRLKKLLVRASGTERVIRITVSCDDEKECEKIAKKICELIKEKD